MAAGSTSRPVTVAAAWAAAPPARASSSESVSHSACQAPAGRSCSATTLPASTAARATARRAAAPARVAATGLRLWGSVDDPPGAGSDASPTSACMSRATSPVILAAVAATTARAEPAAATGWRAWLGRLGGAAWQQLRKLFTVTRVDNPQALLASPSQQEFLRANLKLRVLNARLDLLSRNAVAYASDMRDIRRALLTQFNIRRPSAQLALALAAQVADVDLTAQPAAHLQSLQVLSGLGLGSD